MKPTRLRCDGSVLPALKAGNTYFDVTSVTDNFNPGSTRAFSARTGCVTLPEQIQSLFPWSSASMATRPA